MIINRRCAACNPWDRNAGSCVSPSVYTSSSNGFGTPNKICDCYSPSVNNIIHQSLYSHTLLFATKKRIKSTPILTEFIKTQLMGWLMNETNCWYQLFHTNQQLRQTIFAGDQDWLDTTSSWQDITTVKRVVRSKFQKNMKKEGPHELLDENWDKYS